MMDFIKLDQEEVRALFRTSENQSDIVLALYKMVYPDWDDIKSIEGYPTINPKTNEEIFGMFRIFDRNHCPDQSILRGALWFNKGFSTLKGSDVPEWTVDPTTAQVNY